LDEVIGEKEVLKENIEIKEREIQLYKDKISSLESRINIIEKILIEPQILYRDMKTSF